MIIISHLMTISLRHQPGLLSNTLLVPGLLTAPFADNGKKTELQEEPQV
jgi:hypothetical protein